MSKYRLGLRLFALGCLVCSLTTLLAILAAETRGDAPQVTVSPSDAGAIVEVDGQFFAEYLTQSGHQPVVWPIHGPTGTPVTRSYPVGPALPEEEQDHPHHRSLCLSHGDGSGNDFWHVPPDQEESQGRQIVHRGFETMESDGAQAILVTKNDWLVAGTKLCEDRRTLVFAADENARWIDFSIQLIASTGDVTFGNTKEGTFGIRVPGTIKVDANQGGHIVNSNGLENREAWGQPASWVDYSGPVEGETVGIAILNHPESFRFPTRWHVRTYGLFAANPFGESDFPPADQQQGAVTLSDGESLSLHYRVLLHTGTAEQAGVAEAFERYSGEEPAASTSK